jgi:hypothetical protein
MRTQNGKPSIIPASISIMSLIFSANSEFVEIFMVGQTGLPVGVPI